MLGEEVTCLLPSDGPQYISFLLLWFNILLSKSFVGIKDCNLIEAYVQNHKEKVSSSKKKSCNE